MVPASIFVVVVLSGVFTHTLLLLLVLLVPGIISDVDVLTGVTVPVTSTLTLFVPLQHLLLSPFSAALAPARVPREPRFLSAKTQLTKLRDGEPDVTSRQN